MNTIKIPSRVTLATSYAVIVVLPCVLIMLVAQLPRPAVVATFLTYAFALLPTCYLDHGLLGGIGFHSRAIFAGRRYVGGEMSWDELMDHHGEVRDDDDVAALIDLIEHEPQRGGFLGVSEPAWRANQQQRRTSE